ncbi:MAG: glycosyltransferase family 2 protein [Promethearchaeota archaeon]
MDQEELISVVIPVYNSEQSLEELCERLEKVFEKENMQYEIILVDDCSKDNSWKILKKLKNGNECIKIIRLMKNFGQHNAILCGFNYVNGDYVVTIDDDLQNPPEEIPKLLKKIKNGYDAVIGCQQRKNDKLYKKLGSRAIRYLNRKIFGKPKNLIISSFRIMKKEVTDEIKLLKSPFPYITGMLLSLTNNIANETVKHDKRKYGTSTYSLSKLIRLSFNLMINYSSWPLKALAVVGFSISIFSFGYAMFVIVEKLTIGVNVPGWTSVIVLLSFFNGLILIMLALIGEYLGRIIIEVSNAPQFVIRKKIL